MLSMETTVLLTTLAGAGILVFLIARRSRKKDMYIKREHHIQAFPPDHYKNRR